MRQIYIVKDGSAAGPFAVDVLCQQIQGGRLSLSALAWHEGLPAWTELRNIPELLVTTMPPLPPGHGPASVPTVAQPLPTPAVSVAVSAPEAPALTVSEIPKGDNHSMLAWLAAVALAVAYLLFGSEDLRGRILLSMATFFQLSQFQNKPLTGLFLLGIGFLVAAIIGGHWLDGPPLHSSLATLVIGTVALIAWAGFGIAKLRRRA